MTEELVEKVARAISASKQSNGNTDAVVAQYVETFWRDYIPEARIAVEALTPAPAPAHEALYAAWEAEFGRKVRTAYAQPTAAQL